MKAGISFEKLIQQIYSTLLNIDNEGILVAHDVKIKDKMGQEHQVDVYYEFEKAGISHKVAIECKDWGTAVDNGTIASFYGKMVNTDINNLIVISRSGYQSGAEEYAENHGIKLLTLDELPSQIQLIGKKLESVAFPKEEDFGVPFWAIVHIDKNKPTGSFYSTTNNGEEIFPLFFSKAQAEFTFSQYGLDENNWKVYGLKRKLLRTLVIMMDMGVSQGLKVFPMVCFKDLSSNHGVIGFKMNRDDFVNEYYGEIIPNINDKN